MSVQTDLEGLVEAASLDPSGDPRSYLPRRKHERPHAAYGKRGVYVIMTPVPGLTPPGVFPDDKPFAFPAPPMNTFAEDGNYNHADYNTVGSGQHSQPIGQELRTISFQTIFMDWEPEWYLVHDPGLTYPAQRAVKELCAIRDHGKPFLLRAHQTHRSDYEVNYAATLRSVHWEVTAGEIDAYYVTVNFTEFSTPDIQELLAAAGGHAKLPASVTVNSLPSNRNTLAKLAKFYFGDPSDWKIIAGANGIRTVAPNTVLSSKLVGRQKIMIPARKQTKKPTKKKV